jgi:hypothetical protein
LISYNTTTTSNSGRKLFILAISNYLYGSEEQVKDERVWISYNTTTTSNSGRKPFILAISNYLYGSEEQVKDERV